MPDLDSPTVGISPYPDSSSAVWASADALFDELEQLIASCQQGDSGLSPEAFYGVVLERALRTVGLTAGAIWLRTGNQLRVVADIDGLNSLDRLTDADRDSHDRAVYAAALAGQGTIWTPATSAPTSLHPFDAAALPAHATVIQPIVDSQRVDAVLELMGVDVRDENRREWMLGFSQALATVLLDYCRCRRLTGLQLQMESARQLHELLPRIYAADSADEIVWELANAAREYLQVDRAAVLSWRRGRARLVGVSGGAVFDRRSAVASSWEFMANQARDAQQREPLQVAEHTGDRGQHAHSLQTRMADHLRDQGLVSVELIPLITHSSQLALSANDGDFTKPPEASYRASVVGYLVLENFSQRLPGDIRDRVEPFTRHAAVALQHADRLRGATWGGVWEQLTALLSQGTRRQRSIGASLLALIACGLLLVPIDQTLMVPARILPANRHEIFAAVAGTVDRVHVKHGQHVGQGELLVELNSLEIQQNLEDVRGKLRAARQELIGLRAERADTSERPKAKSRGADVASRQAILQQRVQSLEKSLEILAAQEKQTRVVSPDSGEVLTWDVERQLLGRPVSAGDRLMTVADTSGGWNIQLYIPEDSIHWMETSPGAVGAARPVELWLDAAPGTSYSASLQSVGKTVRQDRQWGTYLPAVARIEDNVSAELRPGALAHARITCGQRAAGVVWFGDWCRAVYRWWAF